MATIVFYEKPGCINNSRQKQLLRESGHEIIGRDLLTYRWQAMELMRFFSGLPITQWFNPNAPRVKSGEINPEKLGSSEAIAMMLIEPLLIRRPLMQLGDSWMVGFDIETVENWIGGRMFKTRPADIEICSLTPKETRRGRMD